jgi:metal-responsive CopG/Arc/MetJ family transcriptional regulator
MQRYERVGISFPRDFLHKIDVERGDVGRSRYIMRLLEKQMGSILPIEIKN